MCAAASGGDPAERSHEDDMKALDVGLERGGWRRSCRTYCAHAAVSCILVALLALFLYLLNEYLKTILFWVDAQPPLVVLALFAALFTLVSFPVAIGYLLLIIACGYLLGLIRGLLTVLACANFGVAVAHTVLRVMRHTLPLQRLLHGDTARALLKVISGPQAFKIVFFARLTPIPFGLQNTIFAVSEVSGVRYHIATCAGLLPAQLINVYLGSTLRSMQDVLHESHLTGYLLFAFQITVGVLLMVWVVQKARRELAIAILSAELGRDTPPLVDTDFA